MNIMLTSNDYKDTITKLKFIGKIQAGEKINTKHYMAIVNNDWWTSVLRTFYNFESRGNTINFINDTIKNAIALIEQIKSQNDADQTVLCNIYKDLAQAIEGIENLKKTYSTDKIVVASLETLIENIELYLKMNNVVIKKATSDLN
jgi:hypothetical protein